MNPYLPKLWELHREDPREWVAEQCRPDCWCGMVVPVKPTHNDDFVVGAGDLSLDDAKYIAAIHNFIPRWHAGLDTPSDWETLRIQDQAVGPSTKWRYGHCFAVKQKKQSRCWCRVVYPVGQPEELITRPAALCKPEARMLVLFHNHLHDYPLGDGG